MMTTRRRLIFLFTLAAFVSSCETGAAPPTKGPDVSLTVLTRPNRTPFDDRGLPMGRVLQIHESWLDVGFDTKNAIANGAWKGPWSYSIDGAAAGAIGINTAGGRSLSVRVPRSPALLLSTVGSGVTRSSVHVECAPGGKGPMVVDADTAIGMQWETVIFDDGNAAVTEFSMGIAVATQLGVTGDFVPQSLGGAAFVRNASDSHWQVYTNPSGGTPTVTATTVTPSTTANDRMRIQILGANESADGFARARFYINSNVVKDIAVDLTGGASGTLFTVIPFFRASATNVLNRLGIGMVDFVGNLSAGDVYY